MRPGIIYKITNIKDGKAYIGQTVTTLRGRWRHHVKAATEKTRDCYKLGNALRKHGPDAFTIEVIAESLEPFLDDLEIFFIALYNTHSKWGYNLTDGGHVPPSPKGRIISAATRAARSKAMKGKKPWNLGKPHSKDHKERLSLSMKGNQNALGKGRPVKSPKEKPPKPKKTLDDFPYRKA